VVKESERHNKAVADPVGKMQSDTGDGRDAQKMLRKNGGKRTPKALLTQ